MEQMKHGTTKLCEGGTSSLAAKNNASGPVSVS